MPCLRNIGWNYVINKFQPETYELMRLWMAWKDLEPWNNPNGVSRVKKVFGNSGEDTIPQVYLSQILRPLVTFQKAVLHLIEPE